MPEAFGLSSFAVGGAAAADTVRPQEWWLAGLQVSQAWQGTMGAGITVALLGTGVAAGHQDLSGEVSTGPDYSGSGRAPGGPFWGVEGTAVAGVIAGHGHGADGESGLIGIAPEARILSVRVTLEFNDPLTSDPAIARRLPDAIAAGIRYAVDHGVRVIDLPLDPGTLGLTGHGNPAAAGGSAAEEEAVTYALSKGVVLVAPAGDDGQGPGIVNYPAAYPGVIAVGAVGRNGQLALFSSRRTYVSLTAPGADLVAAAPADGYDRISTTGTASGVVAGMAALLLARFPHLTVAQVTRALAGSTAGTATAGGTTEAASGASLPGLPARSANGTGYGTVNAARALALAALITAPRRPAAAAPPARSTGQARPTQRLAASPGPANAGALAGSLVRYVVVGLIALIVLVAALLVLMRSRRARGESRGPARARGRGLHEHRRPAPAPAAGQDAAGSRLPTAGSPPAGAWPSPGGWQGGSLGEITSTRSFRPAVTPVPRAAAAPRSGRGPGAAGSSGRPASPPWEPAPPPERMPGPLPVVPPSSFPQTSGPGIRVPRDMPPPAARTDPPPAFDFMGDLGFAAPSASTLPPRPAAADSPGAARGKDFPTRPDLLADPDLPTQQSLDFAAAPVAADYAAPPAPADLTVHHEGPQGPAFTARPVVPDFTVPPAAPNQEATAAGPATGGSYIWDLAATDAFPVQAEPDTPPPAPGAASPEPDS